MYSDPHEARTCFSDNTEVGPVPYTGEGLINGHSKYP